MATARNASDLERRIARRAQRAHLDIAADERAALAAYLALLEAWNRKLNLTGLTDPDEAVDRLVVEPALAARRLSALAPVVMDVGSGGGSPAIPLRICAPRLRLWMVESKVRKAAFLREAVRRLGLTNCDVEARRFEELLPRPDLNEAMDVVTVRAVRVSARAFVQLQAFVRPGGELWLFTHRGQQPSEGVPPQLAPAPDEPLVEARGSLLRRFRKLLS